MAKRFVVGDIHGCLPKLKELLLKVGFDSQNDILYCMGDLTDRGPESVETIRYLMKIKNFFLIIGNHDLWLYHYLKENEIDRRWLNGNHGGETIEQFEQLKVSEEEKHAMASWMETMSLLKVVDDYVLVHAGLPLKIKGGFDDEENLSEDFDTIVSKWKDYVWLKTRHEDLMGLIWDRDYIISAYAVEKLKAEDSKFNLSSWLEEEEGHYDYETGGTIVRPFETDKTLIVGHTPLAFEPIVSKEYHIINLDTGAFRPGGKLTLMNLDSKEFFQA